MKTIKIMKAMKTMKTMKAKKAMNMKRRRGAELNQAEVVRSGMVPGRMGMVAGTAADGSETGVVAWG